MNNIKNFFINDFRSVREALNDICSRQIPLGLVLVYYVITAIIAILLYPFVVGGIILYYKIRIWDYKRRC